VFEWLEYTSVALWVGQSSWGYPFLLSLHAIGLAIVAGLFSMRDLSLLGLIRGLTPAPLLSLSRLAWVGFLINAVSGGLLFCSQATVFVESKPFLLKLVFIACGMITASIIQTHLRESIPTSRNRLPRDCKTIFLAASSLMMWFLAITSGRLIAYA